MKLSSVTILIGFGVMAGLTLAGWHLGSPPAMKSLSSKQTPPPALTPPPAQTESQAQTQPFDVSEAPPYGPATAPEEMKPFPSPAETAAYLKTPRQSAKPAVTPLVK